MGKRFRENNIGLKSGEIGNHREVVVLCAFEINFGSHQ
jgi:hypothetical protein